MPDWLAGAVTFLFTDIKGGARLWECHPDAMRDTLARHDAIPCEPIAGSGRIAGGIGCATHAA